MKRLINVVTSVNCVAEKDEQQRNNFFVAFILMGFGTLRKLTIG